MTSLKNLALVAAMAGAASLSGMQFSNVNSSMPPINQNAKVVINEVYYDVDPTHSPGVKPGQPYGPDENTNREGMYEWFEIYNPNEFSVNLTGWKIQTKNYWDNRDWQSCQKPLDLLGRTNILGPHEFAIVTPYVSTFRYFWGMETMAYRFKEIMSGNPFACPHNPLDNTGDQMILKNAWGTAVDELNYGENITIFGPFNPAIAAVAEGHSIERLTPGLDTDTAADFQDNLIPTPGH